MDKSAKRRLYRTALAAIALLLPGLMAVQLVRAVSVPANTLDGLQLAPQVGVATDAAAPAPAPVPSGLSGVLYTRGRAMVDWNGVSIPVQDGSYAYEGGETVTLAPNAMGLLRLSDGSSVFLCPGSSARVTNRPDGSPQLELFTGTSRFAFRRDRDFIVRVNETLLGPSDARPEAAKERFFVGEAIAEDDGECLLCTLKNDISLALARDPQVREHARAGEIALVRPGDGAQGELPVSITSLPDVARSLIRTASAEDGAAAHYLCRCNELHDFGSGAEPTLASREGDNQVPDTNVAEPETVPEILPPDAPPLALAEPGAPDPFDPNLLPPPAAGEPSDPVVTVAPPAVPGGGTGGGGVASPS